MTIKFEAKENFLIGVISDTHGHLPSGVPKAFKNPDLGRLDSNAGWRPEHQID